MKISFYFGIALLILHTSASAAGYIGINYGETDYDADAISTFDDPNGIEIYVGYKYSENLGFEFGFVDFGEADDGIPPEWH